MGEVTCTPVRNFTSLELIAAKNTENSQYFADRVHVLINSFVKLNKIVLIVGYKGFGMIIRAKKK